MTVSHRWFLRALDAHTDEIFGKNLDDPDNSPREIRIVGLKKPVKVRESSKSMVDFFKNSANQWGLRFKVYRAFGSSDAKIWRPARSRNRRLRRKRVNVPKQVMKATTRHSH